jgi:hypothetical protein
MSPAPSPERARSVRLAGAWVITLRRAAPCRSRSAGTSSSGATKCAGGTRGSAAINGWAVIKPPAGTSAAAGMRWPGARSFVKWSVIRLDARPDSLFQPSSVPSQYFRSGACCPFRVGSASSADVAKPDRRQELLHRQRDRGRCGFAADEVGALLGDHHGCGVGVGRRHARHHRRVDHA